MMTEHDEIKPVQPSLCPMTYSHEMPHDVQYKLNRQFETRNPDHALKRSSKLRKLIGWIRTHIFCVDKCLMLFGIWLYVQVAAVSFVLMLPMMLWIVAGFIFMIAAAVCTQLLQRTCPSVIFNKFIGIFHLKHILKNEGSLSDGDGPLAAISGIFAERGDQL